MKQIRIREQNVVMELSDAMEIPAARVIKVGFEQLGRMLTIYETLSFEEAKVVAAEFGFSPRIDGNNYQ